MSHFKLGLRRVSYDLVAYMRSTDSLVFTFFFPLILISIFAVAFDDTIEAGGQTISYATYYLPGVLAAGVLLQGGQLIASEIATERLDGTLKRLGATPLSAASYLIGKFGMVLVSAVVQVIVVVAFTHLVFDAALPPDANAWGRFAATFFIGLVACTLLGVGLAAIPRTIKAVTAVVLPVVLLLQFISGIYLPAFVLPEWLINAAAVFPVKWLAQGMRAAFLPDTYRVLEVTGEWEFDRVVLILIAWVLVGGLVAVKTFRWNRRQN